jgi:syntaxin-binding protein 1
MRILLLYILFKDGITEEDLQLLLRHSGFESRAHELPLRNLDLLGHFRVTKTFAEHKVDGKSRRRPKAPNADDESYELSRYVPPIKTVLEDLINGTLDPQTWAYTIDQPPEIQPTGQLGSLRTYFISRLSSDWQGNVPPGFRREKQLQRKLVNESLCLLLGERHTLNPEPAMKSPSNGIETSFSEQQI